MEQTGCENHSKFQEKNAKMYLKEKIPCSSEHVLNVRCYYEMNWT